MVLEPVGFYEPGIYDVFSLVSVMDSNNKPETATLNFKVNISIEDKDKINFEVLTDFIDNASKNFIKNELIEKKPEDYIPMEKEDEIIEKYFENIIVNITGVTKLK